MLAGVRDDLVRKMIQISSSLGKSITDYVNEIFEQAVRALYPIPVGSAWSGLSQDNL